MSKPDGLAPIEFKGQLNTSKDRLREHIERNIRLGLPQVRSYPPSAQECVIAAGGPSLETHFADLVTLYGKGAKVVTVNGAHDYCVARGVIPSAHVMIDARPFNARFVANPVAACKYLIASQCHPSVFEALRDHETFIWHCDVSEETDKIVKDFYFGHADIIPGGSTVTLRAIVLMSHLGWRNQHIVGFDGCVIEGQHHAYPQPENENDKLISVWCDGRKFVCAPWMARQAEEFQELVKHLGNRFRLNVIGDGLIAHIVRTGAAIVRDKDGRSAA